MIVRSAGHDGAGKIGDESMTVQRVHEAATEAGTETWFTGQVWLDALAVPPRPSGLRVHRVTFAPGARTHWHHHPLGQVLHGVAGCGLVAIEGEEAVRLGPGDTVWIPPFARHWHGAEVNQLFVHLAIQEADSAGLEADWFAPVSPVEQRAAQEKAK
jgi:quercetin dioxygenase-like cupin family protein